MNPKISERGTGSTRFKVLQIPCELLPDTDFILFFSLNKSHMREFLFKKITTRGKGGKVHLLLLQRLWPEQTGKVVEKL